MEKAALESNDNISKKKKSVNELLSHYFGIQLKVKHSPKQSLKLAC